MKISHELPPNYAQIALYFPQRLNVFYTYGDTIYNPSRIEIPPDIEHHESIHQKQQKDPEQWWTKYCHDVQFRQEQELEAYAAQYQFCKRHLPEKLSRLALDEMADNLSNGMYQLPLSFPQAHTAIRKYGTI